MAIQPTPDYEEKGKKAFLLTHLPWPQIFMRFGLFKSYGPISTLTDLKEGRAFIRPAEIQTCDSPFRMVNFDASVFLATQIPLANLLTLP